MLSHLIKISKNKLSLKSFKKPYIRVLLFSVLLSLSGFATASDTATVAIYASNNDQIISVKKAHSRLVGEAQTSLGDTIISVLQSNHVEQGKFKSVLGTYQMSSNNQITADNTDIFYTSPQQPLADDQLFSIASQLANSLNQESVALFIPSPDYPVSDIVMTFNHKKLNINEAIQLIKKKLPADYTTAFSLYLCKNKSDFEKTKVTAVEWLGSNHSQSIIQNAFPNETITVRSGRSYLVYKDGQYDTL